jgi:hypothetical protein
MEKGRLLFGCYLGTLKQEYKVIFEAFLTSTLRPMRKQGGGNSF